MVEMKAASLDECKAYLMVGRSVLNLAASMVDLLAAKWVEMMVE